MIYPVKYITKELIDDNMCWVPYWDLLGDEKYQWFIDNIYNSLGIGSGVLYG